MRGPILAAALLALATASAAQERRPLVAPPAAASPKPAGPAVWPATAAGRQAERWMAAINDPDPAAYERFVAEHYPDIPASVAVQTPMIRERLGTLELLGIQTDKPTSVMALMKASKSTRELRLFMEVEPDPPNHVKRIGVLVGSSPPVPAPNAPPQGGG